MSTRGAFAAVCLPCLPLLQAMLECSSPWLVNLVATSQDERNIYMMLEAVMGGELFAYLQVHVATHACVLAVIIMCAAAHAWV